jgi:ankyrin repeat protein
MVTNMIHLMKKRLGMDAPSMVKNWVNARSDQGFTALHFASYRGNYELISLLIDEGAEVEVINNEGLNVLHMAAQGNQPLSLVFFKEKYKMNLMSVDEVGSTPLHWAAYTGSKEAFIYLLSWNVDVNAQDKEGLTPLHLAVISGKG